MNTTESGIVDLGFGIHQIDLFERGTPNRTACYVVQGERTVIIETGASLSAKRITAGLEALGILPDTVSAIIVTHIHLDHAGGAGTMAQICSSADIIVHSRGVRHLIDPSRLIAGARSVYGDALETLWGEVLPVPEHRVQIKNTRDTLDLGGGRILTFYDTPGHARHHFSIYDSESNGMFTGDTTGIRYPTEVTGLPFDYILPSTSPSEFDPQACYSSLNLFEEKPLSRIYHGHFGMSTDPNYVLRETRRGVQALTMIAEANVDSNGHGDVSCIASAMRDYVRHDLVSKGATSQSLAPFELDILVNSMGLLWYMQYKNKQ